MRHLLWMCLLVGCTTPATSVPKTTAPAPAPMTWKRDAVTLEASGYVIASNQQRPASWKTTGVFVTASLIATRATHVLRATKLRAITADGESFDVSTVASLDLERDVALLRTSTPRSGPERLRLLDRPKDPRTLRRVPVRAVGLSDGRLSHYDGNIINVTESPELLYHDGRVPQGLDNGPILSSKDGALLGLQRRVQPRFRFSQVLPLWSLRETLGSLRRGVDPHVMFTLPERARLRHGQSQVVCIEAGEAQEIHAPFSVGEDLVVRMNPKEGHTVYYELAVLTARGSAPLEEGLVDQAVERIHTAPLETRYRITLASPMGATEPSCVELEVGALDWSAQRTKGETP